MRNGALAHPAETKFLRRRVGVIKSRCPPPSGRGGESRRVATNSLPSCQCEAHLIRCARPILFPFQCRISSDLSLSMDQPALYSPPPTALHSDPPVAPPSHRWRVAVTLAARRWRVGGAWMVRHGGDCGENPRKNTACNGVNLRPVTLPLVWWRGDGPRTDPKPPHPAAPPRRHHPLAIDRNRWRS